MAPWEGLTTEDGGVAAGERAFSFISKSFCEAQKIAESDVKLVKSRVQSLIDLRATIGKLDEVSFFQRGNQRVRFCSPNLSCLLQGLHPSTHLLSKPI